jgi:hypothetical protein
MTGVPVQASPCWDRLRLRRRTRLARSAWIHGEEAAHPLFIVPLRNKVLNVWRSASSLKSKKIEGRGLTPR